VSWKLSWKPIAGQRCCPALSCLVVLHDWEWRCRETVTFKMGVDRAEWWPAYAPAHQLNSSSIATVIVLAVL
jgi:hypothetical protein